MIERKAASIVGSSVDPGTEGQERGRFLNRFLKTSHNSNRKRRKKMTKSIFARTSEAVEGFCRADSTRLEKLWENDRQRRSRAVSCSRFCVSSDSDLLRLKIDQINFGFLKIHKPWTIDKSMKFIFRVSYVSKNFWSLARGRRTFWVGIASRKLSICGMILRELMSQWTECGGWIPSCVAQDGEGSDCFIKSILGAWNYSDRRHGFDYMTTLNVFVNTSGLSSYLGEITLDGDGNIVSAEAIRIFFYFKAWTILLIAYTSILKVRRG